MALMSETELAAFFTKTRQGILLTATASGAARGVPVWFDWDGDTVRIFSDATAAKVERIRSDPRVSVLVTNDIDEPPMWVRFDGHAEVDPDDDARALAVDVLAPRYWDLGQPEYADVVALWREAPADALAVIRIRPERIHSYKG